MPGRYISRGVFALGLALAVMASHGKPLFKPGMPDAAVKWRLPNR